MPAAICDRYNLAYFSIPKAASTSMKMVLYSLEHDTPWTQDPDKVHPTFPTHRVKPADFEAARPYWRFTILRDPVSRLLSAYGNRVKHHRDIQRDVAKQGRRQKILFRLKNPFLNLQPTANAFYENLPTYQKASHSIWHHTTSVSHFIGSDLSFFNAVYRIKDIHELEQELSRKTSRKIELPREQTAGEKITLDMLSARARQSVLEHTRADYDLLKDYFTPPSG